MTVIAVLHAARLRYTGKMVSLMKRLNAWSNPSKAGVGDAARMAAFLEERSHAPDAQQVNQNLCTTVAARPGERLLEVGSGSGMLCRMMAPRLQPDGCIAGVDISPEMIAEARAQALAEGIQRAEFRKRRSRSPALSGRKLRWRRCGPPTAACCGSRRRDP